MSEFGIGRPVRRVEDAAFLTGNGNYVDDISLPAQSYAYILRSPHPHADIKSIDTEKAAASLGVFAILTGEDVAADGLGGIPCTQLADGGGWLPGNNTFQHGTSAGNIVTFSAPQTDLTSASYSDSDGIQMLNLDYNATPTDAGNNEFSIVVT